ncbi:MAG: hypothetical protein U0326_27695 [Polyangiales bacterium]
MLTCFNRRGLYAVIAAMALAVAGCTDSQTPTPPVPTDVPTDMTPTCTSAQMLCGGACANVQSDDRNCGACGRACPAGNRCTAGACRVVCPTGQVACTVGTRSGDAGADAAALPEVCVLPDTDRANCGMCGRACASGEVCSAGMCTTTCAAALTTCGTGDARFCADTSRDPANCGMCGRACAPGQACASGMCATSCPTGQTACSGDGGADYCADLQADRNNCGTCGTACPSGQACSAGACVTSCPAGQMVCDGACRDLQTDRANCGACGTACADGQICMAGMCRVSCPAGQTVCTSGGGAGVCADLRPTAPTAAPAGPRRGRAGVLRRHARGVVRRGALELLGLVPRPPERPRQLRHLRNGLPCGQVCSAGACVTSCATGTTSCGGSCRDLQSDRANCGMCGTACAAVRCAPAACVSCRA